MSLKDLSQLRAEIDAAVHTDGPLGKTTAPGLNAVLQSLATELTALPAEAAAGKADLDAGGRVPTSQLPSYVDDVLEATDFAALPASGEAGKIYVTGDTNTAFRWSGSQYVAIGRSPVLYPATGQNTDGAMTQKAVTDALSGVVDLTENKALLVRADRSKSYYTGNGTAEAGNADDAVVRAFAAAQPGDYVYITAPVNMPNAGFYAALCVIKGGTNVNLGGFPITTINRQDCLGIAGLGNGTIYGYGSLLTAVGPGSYALNVSTSAVGARYRLLNVNCRATGPGNGILVRAGDFYQEGSIEVEGGGNGVVITGSGSFSHELVGDLSIGGTGRGFYVDSNSKLILRNGRTSLRTADAAYGQLYNAAALEVEQCLVDLSLRPVGGGITCHAATVRITLTDTTVIGGSLIAQGNGATVVLRGNTTLPTAYDANFLRTQGVTVIDERPAVSGEASLVVAPKSGDYTLTLDEAGKVVPFTTGAVVTIPAGNTVPWPVGTLIEIAQEGSGQVAVAAGNGVVLRTMTGLKTPGQWASIGLRQRAIDDWVVTNAVA